MRSRYIVIICIIVIAAFWLGSMFGTYVTIKAVADVAKGFMDESMIRDALYLYRDNIGACFPSNLTF